MKNTLNIGGNLKRLNEPLIMGILNFTPDSFYKDSRFNSKSENFLKKAEEMILEGVDILDIGGFSTRPNGQMVSQEEEAERVIPGLRKLKRKFPEIPVSVDTFRAEIAMQALENGADMINDISGGGFDDKMFPLIIERNCPYVLMHLQGKLQSMHTATTYYDLIPEVINPILTRANYLRENGVKDVILDPGFGFSKTLEQNYTLFSKLEIFNAFGFPVLVGVSRKSMIYRALNISPEESEVFSVYLNGLAMLKGGKIIRVHDISNYKKIKKINSLLMA